jgi:hypothetical protein
MMELKLLVTTVFLAITTAAVAQTGVLFSDDFDVDTAAEWKVFDGSGSGVSDYTAEFHYDYSALGIPAAPNSRATTRGVKFTVNKNDDTADTAGVSAYPQGQKFSGNYALLVDMWLGYNGPAYGGTGATEYGVFGLNHSGDKVTWDNINLPASDGVWFGVTGEAGTGTSGDYRSYEGVLTGPPSRLAAFDAGFLDRDADGSGDNEVNPLQPATFPLKAILPAPPGETPGAPGKQWVEVEVRQQGGVVTWLINGYIIASRQNLSGWEAGNVMIGNLDVFSSIASPKDENFVIYDNLRVVDLDEADVPPNVAITATDPDAAEPGADTGAFTITRTGSTAEALTVLLRAGGTATSGHDYEPLPESIEIPPGSQSVTVPVTPRDDRTGEADESVTLMLVGKPGVYEIGVNFRGEVTMVDDGDIPGVTIQSQDGQTYERLADNTMTFVISREGNRIGDLTVNLNYVGTASMDADFTGALRSVTIAAGESQAWLVLAPKDDLRVEGDETIEVMISPGTDYEIRTPSTAVGTIRDNDLTPGELIYSEDFETDSSAQWSVHLGAADGGADFFFDYSTVGVPMAPNSRGTTRGLKLQANQTSGVFGGLSVSPKGQEFQGDHRLRFDLWQNFNGPLPNGDRDSTQLTGAGFGTRGDVAQWPGGTQDSLWFGSSADGGSTMDFRAYSPVAPAGYTVQSGIFTAASQDAANPYYADFGRRSVPEAQLASYPNQTGTTSQGAPGFQWHDVVITKSGDAVTWEVDGLLLATVDTKPITFGGGNILFAYSDVDGTVSSDPNAAFLLFGLVDNVRVELLKEDPKMVITDLALDGDTVRLRFSGGGEVSGLAVESADTLLGPFVQETGASIQGIGENLFEATMVRRGAQRFYRVVR